MALRYLIIDSDKEAVATLMKTLNKLRPAHEVEVCSQKSKICSHFAEMPDIVFIDPHMDGMKAKLQDYMETFLEVPCLVFMSAHASAAGDAYEYDAIDFLLKPLKTAHVLSTLTKITVRRMRFAENKFEYTRSPLFVKDKLHLERVYPSEILYLEAYADYVNIYTKNKKHLCRSTLKKVRTMLDSKRFLQVHKSYIVQLDAVTELNGNYLVLGEEPIPVGKAYKKELMARMDLVG